MSRFVIVSGEDQGVYLQVPVHLCMHVTSATVGHNGIIASGFVRGFANLSERFDGELATPDGQKHPCVWFGMNTRGGDFFPNPYYPYNQGYMEATVKGFVAKFSLLLDMSLEEIHKQFQFPFVEKHLEWNLYNLSNTPPRYAYRMLNYAAAVTGSPADLFLSQGVSAGRCTLLPFAFNSLTNAYTFSDQFVTMTYTIDTAAWTWEAVDSFDSKNIYQKNGIRVNLCICTQRVPLACFFEKVQTMKHHQRWEGKWLATEAILKILSAGNASASAGEQLQVINSSKLSNLLFSASSSKGPIILAQHLTKDPGFAEGTWNKKDITGGSNKAFVAAKKVSDFFKNQSTMMPAPGTCTSAGDLNISVVRAPVVFAGFVAKKVNMPPESLSVCEVLLRRRKKARQKLL